MTTRERYELPWDGEEFGRDCTAARNQLVNRNAIAGLAELALVMLSAAGFIAALMVLATWCAVS